MQTKFIVYTTFNARTCKYYLSGIELVSYSCRSSQRWEISSEQNPYDGLSRDALVGRKILLRSCSVALPC